MSVSVSAFVSVSKHLYGYRYNRCESAPGDAQRSTHNPILRVLAGQKERHREADRGSETNREKRREMNLLNELNKKLKKEKDLNGSYKSVVKGE